MIANMRVVACAALLVGCGRLGFDVTGATSDAADTFAPPGTCAGSAGPTPVNVGPFCIDSAEVTNDDYAAFLLAKGGDTSGQPPQCAGNIYIPCNGVTCAEWPPASTDGALPVGGADWCDALAYCAWAGKRLCGKIGGGSVGTTGWNDPSVDEWMYACTGGIGLAFPYGNTFAADACNGLDHGVNARVAVDSMPGCSGGFPGVHDMSGNVFEWEDACNATRCYGRGGSYRSTMASGDLQCTGQTFVLFGNYYAEDGLRCCSDVLP
jgi:formylglycine-generating enzyme required for sulfatase activity